MSVRSSAGVGSPGAAGTGSSLTVERSSAVPVLPATGTPLTAAPTPVPDLTTSRIPRPTKRATERGVAWLEPVRSPLRSVGSISLPSSPIAAAMSAIWSGVVSTLPWPIAVEPTARSSPISPAAGIVERAAPISCGSLLKPNRSAAATSRSAPSSAPTGANTELQECANESIKEPPHASPLAFWSSTPSSVAAVWTGKLSSRLTVPASSAPASVMILNTEPGGCGAENATPASASTSPVRGRTAAIPP